MVYYSAIALVSAATLLLELTLLRLFAVQQFYHFAFMAVSLALLGAGASGSLLSVWRRRFSPAGLCLGFGVTTIGAYLLINYLPFDSFSIAWDKRQLGYLALYFLAITIPFLFSGLLIGGELIAAGRQESSHSHRVYGANLMGAALGSLASLPILDNFGGEGAVVVTTIVTCAAGWLFTLQTQASKPAAPTTISRLVRLYRLFLLGGAGLGLWALLQPPALFTQQLSPYKALSTIRQALDSKHTLTIWDAKARIDVVESSTIHALPGLSLLSPAGPPLQFGLMLDGDNLMPMNGLAADSEQARTLAENLPGGLLYQLRPAGRTLVIEAGTGTDVLFALAAGAESVTAVEDNRLIIRTIQGAYREFTHGLYLDPRVNVINQSGRVFARQPQKERFDAAILSLTDPHHPVTSGAYSLTENYVYTTEAIGDYLKVLDQRGLLMVTRWLQVPPSESGRMFSTMVAALTANGLDPSTHLLAFRSLRTMTFVASESPYTPSELEIIRTFLRQRGYDPVYYPGIKPEELNRYNVMPEPVYHQLFAAILQDPTTTYANYRFDIQPATDNHPFFFHFFRWRQTPEILAGLGMSWQPFGGSGFFVLIALLLLVGLAAAVFILGPLIARRRPADSRPPPVRYWRPRVFAYFAALGLAYLFVEIPLAQRFILTLGQPVMALAVVIFTMLLFSGLGSLTAHPWRSNWIIAILVLLIGLYPLLLEPVTSLALRWPEWGRILLTISVLAPLGYLMGIPFAAGLRLIEISDPRLVAWAWAINGSFSVISSVLAVIVALTWGFSTVLWLGAGAYAVGLAAFMGLSQASLVANSQSLDQ